jgi:hypothetical protein
MGWLVDVISLQGEESELLHHVANLNAINGGIIPAATVWSFLASTLPEHGDQLLVIAAAAGCIIEGFVVANPEGDIPGLPVCPSVVAHVGSFDLWLVYRVRGSGATPSGQSFKCHRHHVVSVGLSVGSCDPHCFHRDGNIQPHGLGGIVCLATCPHDLAGVEIGCHAENHDRSVV